MYKRYVDDINICIKNTESATNREEEEEMDEYNIKMIQKIGNEIHPSIELEVDCPSMHDDRKLPILDLKVWIEETNEQRTIILHEFYSKEMANKSVINARSAIPWNNKRTIMTQEVLRILLNCSRELPWEIAAKHVTHLSARMEYSGYDKTFRGQVIKSGLNAYHSILEKEKKGERPVYRPKEWKRTERAKNRREKRTNWFNGKNNKNTNETVVFIPATQGSELKHMFEEVINGSKTKMKVVEQAGATMKSMLVRSNPFKEKKCSDAERCMVCSTGEGGACRVTSVTYEIKCNIEGCNHVYHGETGRNAYTRGLEHKDSLRLQDQSSPLWRHTSEMHSDIDPPPTYTMRVTGTFKNDPTLRQITEGTKIHNTPEHRLMNSRSEWRHTPMTSLRTELTRI